MPWTKAELAGITGGTWEGDLPDDWTTDCIAFRPGLVRPGALVIPRVGSYLYGTYGVDTAKITRFRQKGIALLADAKYLDIEDLPLLRVPLIRVALEALAESARAAYRGSLIAVSGSVGKTTTTVMVNTLLTAAGYSPRRGVHFNTVSGVFGQIANLPPVGIQAIEVAMSTLTKRNAQVLKPDVALITTIGESHLQQFRTRKAIAKVKSRLYHVADGGTAIVPRDSEYFEYLRARAFSFGAKVVSFGEHGEADFRLVDYAPGERVVRAVLKGRDVSYTTGIPGRHMAVNSLGALAAVDSLGLELSVATDALRMVQAVQGRGKVMRIALATGEAQIVDEAYNASPTSMAAVLATFAQEHRESGGRKLALLGDMRELGPRSAELHAALAEPVLAANLDMVMTVGEEMKHLRHALPVYLLGPHYATADDVPNLVSILCAGDRLLVKASNGMGLQGVLTRVRRQLGNVSSATCLPASIGLAAQAAMVLKIPSAGAPQVVYAKNPRGVFSPASLTMLLTTITALNLASRFDRSLNTMLEMIPGDKTGGSEKNITVFDRFSFQDAIANMMLSSSNVTATVVARTFGQLLVREKRGASPVGRFVEEMNATAARLRMVNSTFVHPHGLHASAQVTTSADMAKLLVEATKRPAITSVWGRATYNMTITGPNARTQQIHSSVKMIEDDDIRGGKTGTVRARTYNLAIYSQTITGAKLALLILGSPSDNARYADMRLLLSALNKV
jgi:UDP-N-acetylmuramyl pentapeptide synthase/D-alanyl-D-alanine carboxypeptidase